MALGFGFNKTKVLATAEKNVQQGKFENAIKEYQKVVKADPKDLTVLNTIGDLYSRLGQSEQAILYFKKVGDTYAADGFTVKAIAMYKKITKLTPAATDCIMKLAEMYTQQGLYNDARSQYMQVAEAFMRNADLPSAAKIFQKMLELDPENAAMQSRLADIYMRIGKKDEARAIFFSAAQSLFVRGAHDAADEALGKVLNLDPANGDALMLRGQIAADAGNAAAAIEYLEKVADLDSRADALHALLRARLMLGNVAEAEGIARKLLTVHNDSSGITEFAEYLLKAGDFEAALHVYDQHADRLLSGDPAGTIQTLHASINKIQENARALEILLSLYRRAGESTHVGEVMELLAHAYVQEGSLAKARDLYKELAEREPENELHSQHYRQIVSKLGEDSAVRQLSEEEGKQAFMVDELEISSADLVQEYPEEIADAVKSALTDSELLDSYNLPQKAIQPLETALARAPRDARLNQRLASLYARANRFQEAAACCGVLREVFAEAGHEQEAQQYGEMAGKYQERAAMSGAVAAPAVEPEIAPAQPEFAVAAPPAEEPALVEAAAAPEFSIAVPRPEPDVVRPPVHQEIDLSDEWESHMAEPAMPPPAPVAEAPSAAPLAEIIEEARFYVGQSMWPEARTALARAAAFAYDDPAVIEMRQQIAEAEAQAAAPPSAPVSETLVEPEPVAEAAPAAEPVAEVEPAAPLAPPATPIAAPEPLTTAASADALGDLVMGLEESLGDDFSVSAPPPKSSPKPSFAPVSQPKVAAAAATPTISAPAAAPVSVSPSQAPPSAAKVASDVHDDLSDIFEEFKEGVEESAPEDEDPQTHFNLGVAFKEMGLLDEGIGELQKVCHAIDRGLPFEDRVQAYTLLANCFVEKGMPEASVQWLEKALKSPGIDFETVLAIQYEMASAYEAAGDKKEALSHFMEVYGSNIDYRDVAERIKALRA
jgi:pilus assembly protein FimV